MARRMTSGFVALLVVLSIAAVLKASSPDRPPFVSAEQWVPLSDRAGLVMTDVPKPGKPLVWLNGRPNAAAVGELWVKVNDGWLPAHLEPSHGGIVPAR